MPEFLLMMFIGAIVTPIALAVTILPLLPLLYLAQLPRVFGRISAPIVAIVFISGHLLVFGAWAAICSNAVVYYSRESSVPTAVFWLLAFIFVNTPIGFLQHKELQSEPSTDRQRPIMLGTLAYSLLASLLFLIFSIFPATRDGAFGWLLGHKFWF